MLTDVHSITGYIISKFYFELHGFQNTHVGKRSRAFTINPHFLERHRVAGWILKYANRLLSSLSFKDLYILSGVVLSNFPDIDLIGGIFSKGGILKTHGTWGHSLLCNLAIVPVLSGILSGILKKYGISYFQILLLVGSCIYGHIVLDYCSNYGTAIFFPHNKNFFSLGVLAEWDLPTSLLFYALFALSKLEFGSQRKVLIYGAMVFISLILFKRSLLCDAYTRSYHFIENLQLRSRNQNNIFWLQPSSFRTSFSVMKYSPVHSTAQRLRTIHPQSHFLIFLRYFGQIFGFYKRDFRCVNIENRVGYLQSQQTPREYFHFDTMMNRRMQNRPKKNIPIWQKLIFKPYVPTLFGVWFFLILNFLLRRKSRLS